MRNASTSLSTVSGGMGSLKAPAANARLVSSSDSTAAPAGLSSNRSPSSESSKRAAAWPRSHSSSHRSFRPVIPANSAAVTAPAPVSAR